MKNKINVTLAGLLLASWSGSAALAADADAGKAIFEKFVCQLPRERWERQSRDGESSG